MKKLLTVIKQLLKVTKGYYRLLKVTKYLVTVSNQPLSGDSNSSHSEHSNRAKRLVTFSNSLSGHTLLELVIGMSIFVIVSTIVTYFAIDGWQIFLTLRTRTNLLTDIENASTRIDNYIRKANTAPQSATVRGNNYTANSSTLILIVPSVAADGSPLDDLTDKVVYTVRDEGLVEVTEAGGGVRGSHDQLVMPVPINLNFETVTATRPRITTSLDATRASYNRSFNQSKVMISVMRNGEE